MISVSLTTKGNGQWFLQAFDRKRDFQAMNVDICHRCIGLLLFCKKKDGAPKEYGNYVVFSFQIPPTPTTSTSFVKKSIYKEIGDLARYYEPCDMYFCGGLTDNPWNNFWFCHMFRKLILPLRYLFPLCRSHGEIKDGVEYTRMYMTRPNKVKFCYRKSNIKMAEA